MLRVQENNHTSYQEKNQTFTDSSYPLEPKRIESFDFEAFEKTAKKVEIDNQLQIFQSENNLNPSKNTDLSQKFLNPFLNIDLNQNNPCFDLNCIEQKEDNLKEEASLKTLSCPPYVISREEKPELPDLQSLSKTEKEAFRGLNSFSQACQKGSMSVELFEQKTKKVFYKTFKCRSWRCRGDCCKWRLNWDSKRIEKAISKGGNDWIFGVFTFDRSKNLEETYKKIVKSWDRFRNYLQYYYGKFQYIAVIEQHGDNYPHIHFLIKNKYMFDAIQRNGYKAIHSRWTNNRKKYIEIDKNFKELRPKNTLEKNPESFVKEVSSVITYLKPIFRRNKNIRLSEDAFITKVYNKSFILEDCGKIYEISSINSRKTAIKRIDQSMIQKWGFGTRLYIDCLRDCQGISKYLCGKIDEMSKTLAGEYNKQSQLPFSAPKHFRRIRATQKTLDTWETNPDIVGRIIRAPIEAVWEVIETYKNKVPIESLFTMLNQNQPFRVYDPLSILYEREGNEFYQDLDPLKILTEEIPF